ncbi:MAG: murein biosynthesis integral membrane protein MurJ, partial [Nitrospirae bacterium]|nr:murein biosynthesis integral membrane protein MurJ [Nitrospirota bacterium]
AEGSMSSAFIPVLTEYQTKQGKEEAGRLVRITFTFIAILVGVICIAGIIFAPAIVAVIAPGFVSIPDKFNLTVLLTRVMFPFLLFISLAALVMGALNTRRIFFTPSVAPAVLNIVTIAAILVLVHRIDQPVIAVAIGVALGGLIQFAFQIPSFFRNGYSLAPDFDFRHPGLKKMSLLVIPATMGMAVAQINIFISTILASYLSEGSITYLYYSMRLIQFPIGIFGVAMGMAVLPTLSEHAAKGDLGSLKSDFSFALRMLFFMTVPAMAGLISLREPIVNILFQRGVWGYEATVGTAQALLFYSFGIWAIVGVRIVTACFYSMQDTKTPVKIAVMAMLTNIIFSFILMKPLKHGGLALANAIASSANFIILFFMLRKKLGRIDGIRIAGSFVKISAASAMTGFACWLIIRGDMWTQGGRIMEKAGMLSGIITLFVAVYVLIMYLLGSEELKYLMKFWKKERPH